MSSKHPERQTPKAEHRSPKQRPAPPPKVAAVLLAGGRADDAFQAATGVENRALARIAGRPMAAWVLEALNGATALERIVLVGAEGLTEAPGARQRLRGGNDLLESIERGVGACPGATHVLLVTADVPAITPEAVDAFVRDGIAAGADFVYPIITQAASEDRFPGMKRTYLRLTDGVFTGGNLFLARPEALLKQRELIRRAYAARKRPLRLAALIGWGTLLRLLFRRLSLADAEAALARLLGGTARAIVIEHAALGADVDRVADLSAMAQQLEERRP